VAGTLQLAATMALGSRGGAWTQDHGRCRFLDSLGWARWPTYRRGNIRWATMARRSRQLEPWRRRGAEEFQDGLRHIRAHVCPRGGQGNGGGLIILGDDTDAFEPVRRSSSEAYGGELQGVKQRAGDLL